MTNRNIAEITANLAEIAAQSATAATYLSGPFQLNVCRKALATINVGTPGAGGTVDAKFRWSATSGGTYADVVGALIVQMTAAGIAQLEIRADRVNALGYGPFYKLSITVGVATTPIAATVLGGDCRYQPASQFNDAAVTNVYVVI